MINCLGIALSVLASIFVGSAAAVADNIAVRAKIVNAVTAKPVPQMSVSLFAPEWVDHSGIMPSRFVPEWVDHSGIMPSREDTLTRTKVTNNNGEVEWPSVPRPRRFLILQTTHPNSHHHLSEGWILIDTKLLSNTQRSENNAIKLRPFVTVAGKIVDVDTSKAPPWPTQMSLVALYSKPLRVEPGIFLGGDMTSTVPRPDGSFAIRMAIGTNTFALFGSNICYKIVQHSQPLAVSQQGARNITIRVQKKPGFLIRCQPQGIWALENYQFQVRGGEDDAPEAFLNNYWFIPALKWGQTMQVRVLHRKSKRIVVAWTTIKASPKNWPIIISIHKPAS